MHRSRSSEEQIIGILKEHQAGRALALIKWRGVRGQNGLIGDAMNLELNWDLRRTLL